MLPTTTVPAFINEPISIIQKVKEPPKSNPDYIIKEGDSLTSISEALQVPLNRLWAANPQLTSPDLIEPNKPLHVPLVTDILQDRPMPATILSTAPASISPDGFSNSGNLYSYGFCTWLVKELRPDLPNNLGDAVSWAANARRQGLTVSNTPRPGSVGVALNYGHVVYITAVHGNTVSLKEMNFRGWNVTSERDAPISEFVYIY